MSEPEPSESDVRAAAQVLALLRNASTPPALTANRRWWRRCLRAALEWIGNPFLPLIIGAALAYWLGPRVTQQWADQQAKLDSDRAQLELKTTLLHRISALTIGQIGFIDDRFTSIRGVSDNASPRLRASTHRKWMQEQTDVDEELGAWFPQSSHLTGTWNRLEANTLKMETAQARLRALPSASAHRTTKTAKARADTTASNEKALEDEIVVLSDLRTARLDDARYARRDPLLNTLWTGLATALTEPTPKAAPPNSLGPKAVHIEAAIHSLAIAELNDARARLARRLLAAKATGYR